MKIINHFSVFITFCLLTAVAQEEHSSAPALSSSVKVRQTTFPSTFSSRLEDLERIFLRAENDLSSEKNQLILKKSGPAAVRLLQSFSYNLTCLGNYHYQIQHYYHTPTERFYECIFEQSLKRMLMHACEYPLEEDTLIYLVCKASLIVGPNSSHNMLACIRDSNQSPHLSNKNRMMLLAYGSLWLDNDKEEASRLFREAEESGAGEEATLMLRILAEDFSPVSVLNTMVEDIEVLTNIARTIVDKDSAEQHAGEFLKAVRQVTQCSSLFQLGSKIPELFPNQSEYITCLLKAQQAMVPLMDEVKRLHSHQYYLPCIDNELQGVRWTLYVYATLHSGTQQK